MINPNPPGYSLYACEGAERAARSYKLWRGYKLKATRRATTRAAAGSGQDQGSTFRRKTAGKPENFPFPLVAGKWNSGIFRHFSFSNLKIQKYL